MCPLCPPFGGERAIILLFLAAVGWEMDLRRALLWFGSSWPKISCLQTLFIRSDPLKSVIMYLAAQFRDFGALSAEPGHIR